jgi:glycosyltransferase involved in cell wall biosynthesis
MGERGDGNRSGGPRRVALVHDFLLDTRGAERVFSVMCEMWPHADLFTAVYDQRGTEGRFAHRHVRASALQRLRPTSQSFRTLLPLYPRAMETLDVSGYDLVVSSSSAWSHGVVPDDEALHVCYCHNPFRYAWNARDATLARFGPAGRAMLAPVLDRWREWDRRCARGVDRYVANSQTTRERIAAYWARDADVVHPPVDTARFAPASTGDGEYYVVVSELVPHKRIEIAVDAFNRLGLPLVVVGDGPDAARLARRAGPGVTFTGRVSDDRVVELVRGCRALVVTATEEFGIAAIEAQAAGRPVVALAEGGVRETIADGVTGVLYERPDPDSLAEGVRRCEALELDPGACAANAERFSVERFRDGLAGAVEQAWATAPDGPERAAVVAARRKRRRARRRAVVV